jgi:hypothetical protein
LFWSWSVTEIFTFRGLLNLFGGRKKSTLMEAIPVLPSGMAQSVGLVRSSPRCSVKTLSKVNELRTRGFNNSALRRRAGIPDLDALVTFHFVRIWAFGRLSLPVS